MLFECGGVLYKNVENVLGLDFPIKSYNIDGGFWTMNLLLSIFTLTPTLPQFILG